MTVTAATDSGQDWLQRTLTRATRTSILPIAVAILALLSAVVTYLTLTGSAPIDPTPEVLVVLILINFGLVMLLAALIVWRLVQLWIARRSRSAGARLHGRLVGIFTLIAIVPTVLTAAAAAITTNLAMETWFSGSVRTALNNSLAIADSYLEEHKQVIRADVLAMATDLNYRIGPFVLSTEPLRFHQKLEEQAGIRSLPGVAIYDGTGRIIDSASPGFVLSIDAPTSQELEQARVGNVVLQADQEDSQVRAVVKLDQFPDMFLVAVRDVNAKVLAYQQATQRVVEDYERLERQRDDVQATLALVYALVALVLLFAATWVGLWVANRIVTPIGRLIGAAERVSEGDLSARVQLEAGDDELVSLGRAFNRMTQQLFAQRTELVEFNRQAEQRRRFTEAVLSGVGAGVIGMDAHGRVDIVNRSALVLMGSTREEMVHQDIGKAVPEFDELARNAMAHPEGKAQGQIDISRNGKVRNLLVRVTGERASEDERGFVVTFDDITDLISAQRTSAWADVARRIAHEIKNPLTPIQLSAERLRRKYKKEIATDPEVFEQCTQTIIRQVGDIGRMVDEFSSFARMPLPVMREEDICELIRHAVFLQRVAHPQITFALHVPDKATQLGCDGRLVSQALTNVLKNASEAVRARFGENGEDGAIAEGGRIEVRLKEDAANVAIEIIDNGVGLPNEDRNRLTEPYVTKRAKGTGLGLAIVKKIMEDHKGALTLEDAPATDETGAPRERGALVRLTFPRNAIAAQPQVTSNEQERRTIGA